MQYSVCNNQIRIYGVSQFNINQILDSGQVFRFKKYKDKYTVIAGNIICYLNYDNEDVIIETNNVDFAIKFFDLDKDYHEIKSKLREHKLLDKAITFGEGLRILKQNPLETIISFIISSNNNIPRIKGIIERLCDYLGEYCGGYRAFPTLEALATVDVEFYRSIGAGYRAEYLAKTVEVINNGFKLDISTLSTEDARRYLMQLSGIGSKVADCILLFAYQRGDVFPMDTWCKRIYRDMELPPTTNIQIMAKRLTDIFGNFSGYAQQYLYYYYRENKIT